MNRIGRFSSGLVPIIIIFSSFLFRLYHVGDARFTGDEAFFYSTALETASFKKFPVTGSDVTGQDVQNPGGLVHFIHAIPFLFTDEPVAGYIFVIFLNVCGLFLLFSVLRNLFSFFTASVVILLIAFNPHSVFFSDRLWNPNLLFPLGTATLYLLNRTGILVRPEESQIAGYIDSTNRFSFFLLAFLATIGLQIHLSGVVFAAIIFSFLLFNLKRINMKWVTLGVAAGMVTFVPYIVYDAGKGFANSAALLSHLKQVKSPLTEATRGIWYFVNFAATDMTYYIAKAFWFPLQEWKFFTDPQKLARYSTFYGLATPYGKILFSGVLFSLLLTIASFVHCLLSAFRGFRQSNFLGSPVFYFLLTLFFLSLSFVLSRKAFYMHYIILFMPAALLPLAMFVERIKNLAPSPPVVLLAAFVSFTALLSINRYYSLDEGRLGLSTLKPLTAEILEDSRGADFSVNILLTNTRASDYSMAVLSSIYFKKPWKNRKNARIEYNIVDRERKPNGREEKIVEIGQIRLFKYLRN